MDGGHLSINYFIRSGMNGRVKIDIIPPFPETSHLDKNKAYLNTCI